MKRILVAVMLAVAGLSCSARSPASAVVVSDRLVTIESAEPVREAFNAASDRVRVITLLSPT